MKESEEKLAGGWATTVTRAGDIVYRSPKPQSRTVISFLTFLNGAGFSAAPTPIGSGFAPDGRETLQYIDGSSPQPFAWSDEAAVEIGALLRELHSLSAKWEVPHDAQWQNSFLRGLPGLQSVIGHGDLGPWNILAKDGKPIAFIDWDSAGPLDPLWELAHVMWQNAQLYDDDVRDLNDLPSAEARARQARLIADGYGLDRSARIDVVDRMIQLAIRSAREEAVRYGVASDSVSPAPDGYPILWAVTWRARSAAWMLDHREILEKAMDEG
jgi:Phosphotransferase enzyme family